jgi:hypothetical protein
MACHFEGCRRASHASTMDVFVLPKWAKSKTSLKKGNRTKSSLLGRNYLLSSRLETRLRRRLLPLLHDMFNFG